MALYIHEKARRVPVDGSCDVAVVGGGIAGAAAAIAAARNGVSVVLIEKEFAPGGLATLGNIAVYLPLCDGMGTKVSAGLAEELLKVSVKHDRHLIPEAWHKRGNKEARSAARYRVTFNPASFTLDLEDLLIKSGVKIMYDTRFCDVVRKKDRIAALIVENKDGRRALDARMVIDASGDADVCAAAGEATVSLEANVAAAWFYSGSAAGCTLHPLSEPFDSRGERLLAGAARGHAGDRAADVTALSIACRGLIRKKLKALRKDDPRILPLQLPSIPSFRMTRRLKGAAEPGEDTDRRWSADAIGLVSDWRRKGPVFCVPYNTLPAVRTANLITAGRCISVDNSLWDVTRVIPACAVTGQAAGTAAALAASRRGDLRNMDVACLQKVLRKQKVLIGPGYIAGRASLDDAHAEEFTADLTSSRKGTFRH